MLRSGGLSIRADGLRGIHAGGAELRGTGSEEPAEHLREVVGIGEAGQRGDLLDRDLRVDRQ